MSDSVSPLLDSTPSRRSLAVGAAWSVPAVALAAMAPSVAASGVASVSCPSPGCIIAGDVSPGVAPFYTVSNSGPVVSLGVYRDSIVALDMGFWKVDPACAPSGSEYFRLTITSIVATDQSGGTWTASSLAGNSIRYLLSGAPGGNFAPSMTFTGFNSFVAPLWTTAHHLVSYAMTYTIEYGYYDALHVVDVPLAQATGCTMTETASPISSGNWGQGKIVISGI